MPWPCGSGTKAQGWTECHPASTSQTARVAAPLSGGNVAVTGRLLGACRCVSNPAEEATRGDSKTFVEEHARHHGPARPRRRRRFTGEPLVTARDCCQASLYSCGVIVPV